MKPAGRTDLRTLTRTELGQVCAGLGWPAYRARQLANWLWHKGASSFEAMTDLGKEQRRILAEQFVLDPLQPAAVTADADGTTKFAFRLSDGAIVEAVHIPERDRRTACVSSQVGCGLACRFCATGRLGLTRNLAWHEMAVQVLAVREFLRRSSLDARRSTLTNVVFMGMGEPMLNLTAVLEAVRVINDDEALGIGARHITLSTSGIIDGIRSYARFPLQTRLAVSLNASDDETRTRLMPVNRDQPLDALIAAVRDYCRNWGKRVTFEYVLVAGVNDRSQDPGQLGRLLKGIPCKLNLIPLNPFAGCELRPPEPDAVEAFARSLWPLVPAVTVRRSKGAGISAACGQLAGALPR
jgi:23S rRNA (adenine2503-C2)-methyltransferase